MTEMDLEFVPLQVAAIALYRSVGYEPIEAPGLAGDFVFFAKRLS